MDREVVEISEAEFRIRFLGAATVPAASPGQPISTGSPQQGARLPKRLTSCVSQSLILSKARRIPRSIIRRSGPS